MKTIRFLMIPLFLSTQLGCATLDSWSEPSEDYYQQYQEVRSAPERTSVYIGMPADQVKEVWGEPARVYHAGNPSRQNQKWVYSDSLSGYEIDSSARVIYIEDGRVAGWKSSASLR